MRHICVSKIIIIGSDNGLSPGRRQAIIWTNAGILVIGILGINFSEILFEIYIYSFKKMHVKLSSAKWRLFPLGLSELMACRLFVCKWLSRTIPHDPSKATKLTIVTCSAIWYEAQQLCCGLTCNIRKRTYVLFVYLIMYTWRDKYVYLIMYTCKLFMYTRKIIMYRCKIVMYTCKMIMYTYILNYVYMPDNYVLHVCLIMFTCKIIMYT